jgi:hypothetical protein
MSTLERQPRLSRLQLADYLCPYFWTLAALTYGLGDLVTTLVGYQTPSVVENVPITHWFWETGGPLGLLAMKLLILGSLYSIYRNGPRVLEDQLGVDIRPLQYAIPVGCIHAGALLTVTNLQALGVIG